MSLQGTGEDAPVRGSKDGAEPEKASPEMRDRIVGAARTLFYRQGFGDTSMAAIAAELDISAPALYWHFSSKQELCFVAVLTELERFVDGLSKPSPEPTPDRELASFVSTYVILKLRQSESLKTPGAAGVYSQLREALTTSQQENLDRMQRQVVDQLRGILRKGANSGAFQITDLTVTTFAVISLCEYVFSWFDPNGPLSAAAVGEEYEELALKMVGAGA